MKLNCNFQALIFSTLLFTGVLFSPQISFSQIKVKTSPASIMELPKPKQEGGMPLMSALQKRATERKFTNKKISEEVLSDLLWAAFGVNRPESGKRTAPSARNCQEIELYVFSEEGVFYYNAYKHVLEVIAKEDLRQYISAQPHFGKTPVSIVLVADYGKMKMYEKEDAEFYAAVDAGYISQNIYLFCTSENINTVACGGINRKELQEVLKVKYGKVLLAHPIGYSE